MPRQPPVVPLDPAIARLIADERARLARQAREAKQTREAAWNLGGLPPADSAFRRTTQPQGRPGGQGLLGGPPTKPRG